MGMAMSFMLQTPSLLTSVLGFQFGEARALLVKAFCCFGIARQLQVALKWPSLTVGTVDCSVEFRRVTSYRCKQQSPSSFTWNCIVARMPLPLIPFNVAEKRAKQPQFFLSAALFQSAKQKSFAHISILARFLPSEIY
jgi:hypothetical protein